MYYLLLSDMTLSSARLFRAIDTLS